MKILLERHCELAREMKLYEKIAIDELSVDDIAYYLKLRREYEELQNQVANLIPSVLKKINTLLRQAQDKLVELAGSDYLTQNYPFLKELAEITGELEADAEKVAAGCSRLGEVIRQNQDQETDFRPVREQALAEAACAAEPAGIPVNPEDQERKNEPKIPVSPDTIKKIELMVKPREGPGKPWAPLEEKQNVIKINTPPEPKKNPPKTSKDKGKR